MDQFSIKRALFCLVTVIFALIFSLFIEPFLTDHLVKIGYDKSYVGYFFAIFAGMYTIMAFCVGPLTKRFSSRKISFMSYMLIALGCFIFGPSKLLGLHDLYGDGNEAKTASTVVGLLVLGGGTGSVVVPILVELVTSIKEEMGASGGQQANDKASGLFTMCSALGTILGPVIGGALYDSFGVQTTCDIFALASITMGVIFFIANIWPGLLLKKKLPPVALPDLETKMVKHTSIQASPKRTGEGSFAQGRQKNTFSRDLLERSDSKLIDSYRGSSAIDMVMPVTQEHKMYLAGIDEDEDFDEDESRK